MAMDGGVWLEGTVCGSGDEGSADGPLVGGEPRGCCREWAGAVGWDEGFRFCCLEGVVTDGPLVGDGPRLCGGRTVALGWDVGFRFCCL